MEKDYRKISKNNNLGKQEKEHLHYRMYKAKKSWLFAGMFMLGLLSVSSPAKADTQQATVDNNQADANTTSASTNTADDVNASSVALKSASNSENSSTVSQSDTNSDANADSTQTTPTTSADTATTDSNAVSTQTDTTDQSAKVTTDASKTATTQSDTDLNQQAKSAQDGSSSTATTAQKAASDATTASTTLDGSKLAAATDQTASDANKQNAATAETAAATADLPSNVKVTSENGVTKITLVNPTTEELNEAKQSAASLYKSKGVAVEIVALDAGTNLPVGDPNSANYKAGYQAAANDLINHKGLASTGSIGDALAQADVTMQYTLLSNLYGLGKVYEAGRMANGADTSKDIHYTMDDITKQDRAPILGIGGSQGKTNVDIPTTKTTNPYNIDITNPNSWWIDSKHDGISTSGGSIFGGGTTTNLQSDKDFQAGYQAFIKQWAQSLDNFYTNLGSSLKSDGDAYANAINYDSSAESGQTIGLPIIGGVLGLLGADSVSNRLSNASTQSKAIYQLYVDAEKQAYSQAQASVTDSNALKAIQTNLGDIVYVWDYYIPLFQPLIQSYLEKAIMSNPVSLAGQNDFDVQFLNDGTTFADIVFNIMNGFNYNGNYLTFAVKDHLGDIDFPREIFSQFVTAIYPAIRNVIEHVDYAAAIDGENDFFDDYLNKANAITQSGGKLTTSDNVSLNGKIGFDQDQPVGKSTQLSHDGFYNTADTFLGKIKEAAFDAAVNGQGGDASQFYLNSSNTNGKAVVLDKKGNVYADYSKDLGDTNAMIQATYDAEYQAVVHAIADYKAGQKHNYAVKYTTYSDGSYSYTWDQQAGSDGKFTWTNPAAVNDTKNWYQNAIGTTTSYSDGKDNKYATYDINVADYNNMYNYLASQKDATPATVVATVDYVAYKDQPNEVIVGTGNAVGTDGKTLTVTLTPPAGYELDNPTNTSWTVTLNSSGTNETKVGVHAIQYSINHPGTLPGTSIDYLQGTANLTDVKKSTSSSTTDSRTTSSVQIKRTAELDPTTNQVKYGNWQTIGNSDTIVAPLNIQNDAGQTSLVSIDIETGNYQANNTTYPGEHVATLQGNVAVTGKDLGQKRVTNPAVTSSGNDNEYLGQKPAEVFDITRTIVTVPTSEVTGTLNVTTNYKGDLTKAPTTSTVNVTRDASIDANGHVTYGAWTVKGSTDATAPLVSELSADDPSLAQAGFTVTNVDAPAYTSAQFAQAATAGTTGYTAAITRTVTYTKKTYTTTTPGGTNDPAGTQAKYLEGTITVHRTNTGDYTATVDDKPVSVTRDAWIDTDGTTVKYGDWKAADGTTVLVPKLTTATVGVAQTGFTATIKAGEGDTDYTSANFKAVTDGQTPTDTGYSVTVNQTVNYKADKVSYQVDLYDGYANQSIDSFTMTSIPGSTVDFTTDPTVLSVLQKHTGYIITPVINGVDANKPYRAVKVVNGQSYGVFVSKIASPIQVNPVNTDGTAISGSKGMPMYQIKTTTPGAELVVGQTYTLTPDTVSGYNYQSYDFNGTAGTGTPTVTLTDKDNIFKLVYGTKTYTTTTPGGTNDPKGTQAAYLEGKIIVHQANTGDYSVPGPTETVHVSRTATLGGTDGKTVVYGAWTRDDKPGTDLVPVLTDADVAVSGYKADIKNSDGMTSAQFKVLTDKATAPGIDGYTATINHLVNYTKIVYTTTNPGGTDDPAGTQAKYLEGTITVNRTNSGDYTVSPDAQTVRVTRTASLDANGHVGYTHWIIADSTNDGTTNTVLVPALTDASVAVPGYTPNILNGAGLDSDGFEAINTSAAGKLTDDGYTATVNQTVNYLKTIYTTTAPGGDSDPKGTQAQYLKGKITVTRANTGAYTVPVKDQTIDVTRTASLNEVGKVTYTDWKTADGSTILVQELTEADAAVPGYTAQVFNGGAYKSASFNADIDGTEPDTTKGYYTATVERGVNYKAKTYTTTTPGGTDDPAGTQAKYLEGTITVTTTYTGGPDKATKTANVAVTRTASLKDGKVAYSGWTDKDGNSVLVPKLTTTSAGVPESGYTATITAGGTDDYTSDSFDAAIKGTDPAETGYSASVDQAVSYAATEYTTTKPGDPTKGDPEGTQAKYLEGTITVTTTYTGGPDKATKTANVAVTRTASLKDGKVAYSGWTDKDGNSVLVPKLTTTSAGVPESGYTATITAGGTDDYTSDSFDAAIKGTDPAETGYSASVDQAVSYAATEYTTTKPGDPTKGDPEGTQAKYLEGTITVTTTYTGGPDKATKTANVAVTRTASLKDGKVAYSGWTDKDGNSVLVPKLTTTSAGVPESGYTATITAGGTDDYTSDSFDAAIKGTDPAETGYSASVDQAVSYAATEYTTTKPGDPTKGDPEGTQAKYLEGTITVTTTYTGGPDKATKTANVAVTRTASLKDGKVAYSGWTDKDGNSVLVPKLTTTSAGVPESGYTATITAGGTDDYTSDSFDAAIKGTDPAETGYSASVDQAVSYAATEYTTTKPGDPTKGDPEGTQAKYLEGTITVTTTYTGGPDKATKTANVAVTRTASLKDGKVAYSGWTDKDGNSVLVPKLTTTSAGVPESGYTATITAGGTDDYTSDSFDAAIKGTDPAETGYSASVDQAVSYAATEYTTTKPGDPTKGDPEGTQAKYLEGTITVTTTYTGGPDKATKTANVAVTRTASLKDGKVAYSGWTDKDGNSVLVPKLTTTSAGVPESGYTATITAGGTDDYTSDSFDAAIKGTDPAETGYSASVDQAVSYAATEYTTTKPGDPTKGDPEGTQAKYLEGTITVTTTYTGGPDKATKTANVAVTRTASLKDGKVAYSGWTDKDGNSVLVPKLTTTSAGVPESGYTATITAGGTDDYTSDSFDAAIKGTDPAETGYSASVDQAVKYDPDFKSEVGEGVSVDPKDYYNVTTTTDPEGGTTDTKVDGSGAVTEVTKNWSDGDKTVAVIETTPTTDGTGTTSVVTVTETPKDQPSLPAVTVNPGETVKTGKTTVTNDNPGVTMTHDTTDNTPGLGESVTGDGTVSYFKSANGEGVSVDPKDYYNVTTTTDPEGGTTDTKVDGSGAVTEVTKNWSDGDKTVAVIKTTPTTDGTGTTSVVTVTETPKDQPSLPAVTVNPGETVKTGKTTVTNDNPGVTMTHDTTGTDTNTTPGLGEHVTGDGTVSYFKSTNGEGVSVDPKDYYNVTTTTDPEGGTTDTKVDGSGAVTEVTKNWSDGDKTVAVIETTPTTDGTGTTSVVTVTETPKDQPSLPAVTVNPGETVKTGKTTVTNDNPGVTMTHDTTDNTPGLGESVTGDGTVSYFKSANGEGVSVDPKDYYNVTTTTDPEGGTTDTKVDGSGAVTEVTKNWSDGDKTVAVIKTTPTTDGTGTTSVVTVTETPKDQPSLPAVTVNPGETVKTGKTTVTNDNPGVTMTHDTTGTDTNTTPGLGEHVTGDGTVSYFKSTNGEGVSVDPKDYYNVTTTTDPEGGTTDTKVDGSGAVTEVTKNWSDGDKTVAVIETTPTTDGTGTTSVVTVTETPKDQPSLPAVTVNPGETVKTGKTTVTNDNPGVTMTHDTTDNTPGLGEHVTGDGTVSYFKSANGEGVSVDPKDYYNVTTTTDPEGGTTDTKVDGSGAVTEVTKNWSDGDKTVAVIETTPTTDGTGTTSVVTVTETPKDQPSLPAVTVNPGETVKTGKTTVTNDNPGVTMTHDTTGTDTNTTPGLGEHVTGDGTVSYFKSANGEGVSVDPKDYYNVTTTTDPEGGTTDTKVDGSGAVTEVTKNWSDGDKTVAVIETTPTTDGTGTTSVVTVTETPKDQPSLPAVTVNPGETVKTGKTTVTNDNPGVTMTHDTTGTDTNTTPGLGEHVTGDGTVSYFKSANSEGVSVDPKDYYNVTTTTDPEGGTTDTKVDGSGAVTEVTKNWSDGDKTVAVIETTPTTDGAGTTSVVTVTETPKDQPSLPAVTVNPGETVKTGKTTVTNDNPGVTMTHDTTGTDTNTTPGLGEHVTGDGTVSYFKSANGEGVSVDPKDYYNVTTTTDPEGGTTDTKVDGSGAVTEVTKNWSDGDKTVAVIETTPTTDGTGTTSVVTVTETPKDQPSLPAVTVNPGETVKTGKTTVTNDNPGVTMTHDTTDNTPGLGESVTGDGTVSYFKSANGEGVSVDPKDYYNVTTTTDPEGGTTDTKVDGSGAVTEVTKNWSDGDKTVAVIETTPTTDGTGTTSVVTVTETPKDQPSLPAVTVNPGETVKTGKTTVTNDNPGVTMTHDTTDNTPGLGESVTGDGTVSYFKSANGEGTSVDPKDYYNVTTTTDPEGGTTDTKVDGSGAVTEVTKNWSDGDKTVAVIETTPTTDGTGTTSVVTVTETPKDQPSLPAVTVKPGETVKTGKTTVTNDNPGVTMTHDTLGTDTNGKPTTDQTGETINPDGTSSFWKVPEPVSTTKDGYYVTTTTKDPDGGTTDTKVDGSGAVTQIDKTWGDGDKTNVTIDKNGNAVFTETPNGQPSLPSQTVTPGNTATAGKTTLTNNEPNGIQLTHKPGDAPSVTETVTPDGSITFGMMPEPVSVEKSGNTNGNPGKPGDNDTNPTGNTGNEGGNTNTSTGNGTGLPETSTGTDTTTGSDEGTAVKTPNGESSNGGSTTGGNTGNTNVSTNVAGDQSVGNNQASVTGTNGNVSSQNQKTVAQGKLPQTNDQKNSVGATIGLGLLGLLAALGLKRKKRDDE